MRTRLWAESDVATVVPWSTLTLLLTDVVDSTGPWDSEPDVMAQAIERHRILIHLPLSGMAASARWYRAKVTALLLRCRCE